MKKVIETQKAPQALGPYSQGIFKDNFCFVSMELGIDPNTNSIRKGSIEDETNQAILNVQSILEAAGYTLDDVVKVTLYIKDMSLFQRINKEYEKFFSNNPPARSLVVACDMPLGALVAIDAIAIKSYDYTEEMDYHVR